MAEYIEREALLKFIENGLNNPDKTKAFGNDAVEIMTEVQYAPAADVVEVVRCGQCVQWDTAGKFCHHPAGMSYCGYRAEKVGFCYFGERRNDHAAD